MSRPHYTATPVFEIQPGQLIVDRWLSSRGPGTLSVAYVREVTEPARWDHHHWGLVCRGEVYTGMGPASLPVLRVDGTS